MMNPQSPHAKYHGLPDNQETAHDDGSLTDYEEDDKLAWSDDMVRDQAHTRRRESRGRTIRGTISSFRALFDTVLLLVIVWLLLERRDYQKTRFEFAGDITGFAPQFSQQITTFSPDPGFVPENVSDFFSRATRDKWLSLVPRGLGYITINDTTPYRSNLPTPLESYPDFTFTTSMTHQLHCLHAIAEEFAALTGNRTDLAMGREEPWHLAHCFDYLRQSIMCCGDVALEGQQTTFPEGLRGSDGWDAKHVCKDYGEIKTYLERNRANSDLWI